MEAHIITFVVVMLSICYSSEACNFYVGGKDGWVLKPSETYSHWAQRNRFQVNDSLIFKYKKGSDSVLLVNKDDYYRCNKANPIQQLNEDHGESLFKFNHSGPFFFISGQADNCEEGQKIIIVVLAVRNKTPTIPSPAIPSPSSVSPPAESPNGEAPESGGVPAPAPAPAKSDAAAVFGVSGGLVMVLSSVGMSVVLGGLVGLF